MTDIRRRSLFPLVGGLLGAISFVPAVSAQAKCTGERFQIRQSGNDWYWTLFASNGKKIADTEGYSSPQECERAIRRVKAAAARADIVYLRDCE